MVLKLEMFNIVGLCTCSYQGDGNQLLIAQVAGHFKIQKLCAESLDVMVSNALHMCIKKGFMTNNPECIPYSPLLRKHTCKSIILACM